MRLSVLGFFFLLLAVDSIPAVVAILRMLARGRAAGVRVGWHVGVAIFACLIAGILLNGLAVHYILFRSQQLDPVPVDWQTSLVIASGLSGSALAAGAVYLHLRMKTQRDPDYEEPVTDRSRPPAG